MKQKLLTVIEYLEGKTDIYDGVHNDIISAWDAAWDEMRYMGYKPDSVSGIKQYIKEQL